jgi:hypothetical protein
MQHFSRSEACGALPRSNKTLLLTEYAGSFLQLDIWVWHDRPARRKGGTEGGDGCRPCPRRSCQRQFPARYQVFLLAKGERVRLNACGTNIFGRLFVNIADDIRQHRCHSAFAQGKDFDSLSKYLCRRVDLHALGTRWWRQRQHPTYIYCLFMVGREPLSRRPPAPAGVTAADVVIRTGA